MTIHPRHSVQAVPSEQRRHYPSVQDKGVSGTHLDGQKRQWVSTEQVDDVKIPSQRGLDGEVSTIEAQRTSGISPLGAREAYRLANGFTQDFNPAF